MRREPHVGFRQASHERSEASPHAKAVRDPAAARSPAPRHHPRRLRSHPKAPGFGWIAQAQANLTVAQVNLTTIDNQKAIQRALVRQAQANIEATTADLVCDRLVAQKCHKNRQNVRQLTDARRKAPKSFRSFGICLVCL
jgi:hypothetical protein